MISVIDKERNRPWAIQPTPAFSPPMDHPRERAFSSGLTPRPSVPIHPGIRVICLLSPLLTSLLPSSFFLLPGPQISFDRNGENHATWAAFPLPGLTGRPHSGVARESARGRIYPLRTEASGRACQSPIPASQSNPQGTARHGTARRPWPWPWPMSNCRSPDLPIPLSPVWHEAQGGGHDSCAKATPPLHRSDTLHKAIALPRPARVMPGRHKGQDDVRPGLGSRFEVRGPTCRWRSYVRVPVW